MTRRTSVFLAALLAVAVAWPAAAAEPAHRPRCNDLRALAKALALTKEQVQATRTIYKDLRGVVDPLREEIEPLREELQDLLDENNPAPGQVGQIVIDIDALRDEIAEARDAAEDLFEELLTPEQLAKYDIFEDRCRPGSDD